MALSPLEVTTLRSNIPGVEKLFGAVLADIEEGLATVNSAVKTVELAIDFKLMTGDYTYEEESGLHIVAVPTETPEQLFDELAAHYREAGWQTAVAMNVEGANTLFLNTR